MCPKYRRRREERPPACCGAAMTTVKILIVDADERGAAKLTECLDGLGHSVCGVVACGRQAMATAGNTRPDLALVDLGLDGEVTGVAAGELLASRFDVPVVYLTDGGELLQRAAASNREQPVRLRAAAVRPAATAPDHRHRYRRACARARAARDGDRAATGDRRTAGAGGSIEADDPPPARPDAAHGHHLQQHQRRGGGRRQRGQVLAVQSLSRADRRRRHAGLAARGVDRALRRLLSRSEDPRAHGTAAPGARHPGRSDRRDRAVHPQRAAAAGRLHQRQRPPPAPGCGLRRRRRHRVPRHHSAEAGGSRVGADDGGAALSERAHRYRVQEHQRRHRGRQCRGRVPVRESGGRADRRPGHHRRTAGGVVGKVRHLLSGSGDHHGSPRICR